MIFMHSIQAFIHVCMPMFWMSRTVETAYRKFIDFMQVNDNVYIGAFTVLRFNITWKSRASRKYFLRFTDSMFNLVTWNESRVVFVNNHTFNFRYCKCICSLKFKVLLMNVLNNYCSLWKLLQTCIYLYIYFYSLNHVNKTYTVNCISIANDNISIQILWSLQIYEYFHSLFL